MALLLQRFSIGVLVLFVPLVMRAQEYVVDTLVTHPNTISPVSIAFSPDNSGKFFFAEKNSGRIGMYRAGNHTPSVFAAMPVRVDEERGLLGVTVHPAYPDSPFVYVLYTRRSDARHVVARYRDSSGVGVKPVTIFVSPQANPKGIGGRIHFGPDGKLYIAFGDGADPRNAQDTASTNLSGKILRLNSDGSIPSDNPWKGKPFWSMGHHRISDFTFDDATGILYCADDGEECAEEVDRVPRGGNLGWPDDFDQETCEYLGNSSFIPPLYSFTGPGRPGLAGITVYRGRAFPRLWGKILLAGNRTPSIWTLVLQEDGDNIAANSLAAFPTSGTGYSDIAVGPDGFLYVTNGAHSSVSILRMRPVAPVFTSTPPATAVQGVPYAYAPTFKGTSPEVWIVSGPQGVSIDSGTLNWVPTNQEALQHLHSVRLRAENGAGSAEQEFAIAVTNVNDPPGSFGLSSPPGDTALIFVGNDPVVHFAWEPAVDPDRDTIGYTLQTDTVATFNSSALRDTIAGTGTSLTVPFPKLNARYYWRVKATDGLLSTTSSEIRRVIVTFTAPVQEGKSPVSDSRLEQNFPNPFNPSTSIVYTIPKNGFVRLAVFNLLGQEVALIFEGNQSEGTHEVEFRNAELPSGIYFYRIQAPNFVETRKLTILR